MRIRIPYVKCAAAEGAPSGNGFGLSAIPNAQEYGAKRGMEMEQKGGQMARRIFVWGGEIFLKGGYILNNVRDDKDLKFSCKI